MTEVFLYGCTVCGNARLVPDPPALGAVCQVCATVDSQIKVLITVTRTEETVGPDVVAAIHFQD